MAQLDVNMLRGSFEKIKPVAEKVSNQFYTNLFSDYPETKILFQKTDILSQKMKLINSLVFIFDHLDKPEKLEKFLTNMGSRHIFYGAKEEHYALVGNTLIKTLGQLLGSEFTPELKEQWILAYSVIESTMKKGAKNFVETKAA